MIAKINTLEDVHIFAEQLIGEGLNFHPDDDFNDYVNLVTNKASYNKIEADVRNKLMDECFEICKKNNIDIYKLMMKHLQPKG
ncbi:hypothetical protein BSF41_45340 [Flavobacterium sp. ACN2]|uniref:hypothetical protein n=1 Tax=Flavobacterium sp. ACN2 TaxID=1975676 RepID=UPI000BB3B09E|nr:hypothetical protein [Flavobacterium sp. ACN2]PBI83548.1 hypothetical protein BSF41_45340 [Flavobacterium sp. ACN2]